MRHDLFRFSGSHIPQAAILIRRTDLGTHTGVIYRDESGGLRLLDFRLGGEIVNLPWDGRHAHVLLSADEDALENLASLCRVIARRYSSHNPEHLFGFKRNPSAVVRPNGELYLGDSVGATCASFVLIVLDTAKIELVVSGPDWPHRPHTDDARHAALLPALQQLYQDPAYIDRVRAELPCPRVAPEEVAGAAVCPTPPADQAFAERAARWILGLFEHNDKHGV
jgi:hypothetical protein